MQLYLAELYVTAGFLPSVLDSCGGFFDTAGCGMETLRKGLGTQVGYIKDHFPHHPQGESYKQLSDTMVETNRQMMMQGLKCGSRQIVSCGPYKP